MVNSSKDVKPLTSEELQSEDDKGGGVSLSPEDAPGHTLPASETGAESQSGRGGPVSPIIPPD
jgi:hypothetical protein